jgi:hypothetical protein
VIVRTDDYPADYRLLGLQPGCSVETLERTWRRAVSALHPDRRQALGLEPAQAEQRLHQITAAYRRLRSFEREHGRLPGGAFRPAQEPSSTTDPAAAGVSAAPAPAIVPAPATLDSGADLAEPPPQPAARPTPTHRVVITAIALLLGTALWFWPGSERAEPAAAAGSPSAGGERGLGQPALRPTARAELKLGSTLAEVEALLGPPLLRSEDAWEYGPSHVRFEGGRVSGWYSSPLRPLPVDRPAR